ncbi:hypothetical protein D5F01_LYC24249 [Larimichthys crocea]|uniref:Uncharacterized protein n=1 Tax=Larimichthys crocea TaxID=215358 RepID=A0A6G0HEV8_LARCR|nr:hypothetical protein D5F01_LYC24249 [Larimichthys crocea]
MMAALDVEAFASDPSLIVFDKCKKNDLRVVAEYYGVPVSSALAHLSVSLVDLSRESDLHVHPENKLSDAFWFLSSLLVEWNIHLCALMLFSPAFIHHGSLRLNMSIRSQAELKTVLLDELISRGVLSLPVSGDALVETATSPGEGRPAGEAEAKQPITPVVKEVRTAGKLVTMPHFVPFSVESTPGSKADARLKVRLARMQLEKEEREREFQFCRELELKRLEADTAVRLRQVELQVRTTQAGEVQPAACPSKGQLTPDAERKRNGTAAVTVANRIQSSQ